MRKNLIIVRGGDASLHPQWLMEKKRNWDLALSYYGDFPDRYKGQYEYLHLFKGSKWQGIKDFVEKNMNIIMEYEYVWLPDDDLFSDGKNISNFFEICKILNLTIAQPSLTRYSYYSWPITLQVKSKQKLQVARITNFVEIMAPCFNVKNFPLFSNSFGENTSGFGYEFLWWKLAEEAGVEKFGIVDLTPIYHTRPVGSAGHGGALGSTKDEEELLLKKYNLKKFIPQVYKSIQANKFNGKNYDG